jgi:cold shock protein
MQRRNKLTQTHLDPALSLVECSVRVSPTLARLMRKCATLEADPSGDRAAVEELGTVKWYNANKGFGFIAPDQGGKDIFVHASLLERAGITGLAEGQRRSPRSEGARSRRSAAYLKRPEPCEEAVSRPRAAGPVSRVDVLWEFSSDGSG